MLKPDYLGKDALLGYCTNVHPSSTARDIAEVLKGEALEVREKSSPEINFGLSLWLSASVLAELKIDKELAYFKSVVADTETRIFSWNAFPYSDFHGASVKQEVYSPSWVERERLNYTRDLVNFIEHLHRDQTEISISTLPIADQARRLSNSELRQSAVHLVEFVKSSFRLQKRAGLLVHLNLEPEPLCTLQTSQDVIEYYKTYLLSCGVPELKREFGLSGEAAEELLLDRIRICYDTCHAAVMFETPDEVLRCYESLGVKIGKVQLSSALAFNAQAAEASRDLSVLDSLSRDRYLHQVIAKSQLNSREGEFEKFLDLPEALEVWQKGTPKDKEYRIHYHVPIFLERFEGLRTTQDHIIRLLELAQRRFISNHWEVETYTWTCLPGKWLHQSGTGKISDKIASEVNWVHQTAKAAYAEAASKREE